MIAARGLLRSARAELVPVAALMLVTGLFRASQNMSQTTLSLLGAERVHAGPQTIGILSATSFVVMLVGTLLVAPRVGPHSRRAAVALGLAALAVGQALFALADDVGMLAGAAVLTGIAGGITLPTLATIAGQAAPERRDRTLALYALALSVSLAAGPLVESALLRLTGGSLRAAYLVFAAAPALALALILVRVRRGLRAGVQGVVAVAADGGVAGGVAGADGGAAGGVAGADGGAAGGVAGAGVTASAPWRNYRAVMARPLWRLAVIGVLMYEVPFVCVLTFGAVLAERLYGQRAAGAQLAFAAFFASSLATRAVLAWRSPIRRKLALLWLSTGATVVGLGLLAAGHGTLQLLGATAVLGIPHGLTYPIALGLSAEGVPRGELAWANAALISVLNLAAVVTPGLLGALVLAVGYRAMVAVCLAPVAGFAIALAWQGRRASAHLA